MIAEQKKDIDVISIIEGSGIELIKRGRRYVALCPFHAEKTPSFYVFDDGGFKCFGCGEHGDVIAFVQKLYGLSFPDALKHLGIEQSRISPEIRRKIEQRKLERQQIKAHKKRIADLQHTLLILISATRKAVKAIRTIEDFEKYGDIFQPLAWWEYCLDLISFGTKEEQAFVCKQFRDEEVLPVKGFFNPDFDYLKWLIKFDTKRPENAGRRI